MPFRRKGDRKVNGVWHSAEELARPKRTVETAADRRNWLRKKAGWPVLQVAEKE